MKQYKQVKLLSGNKISEKISVGNIHFQTCNGKLYALVEYSYDIA